MRWHTLVTVVVLYHLSLEWTVSAGHLGTQGQSHKPSVIRVVSVLNYNYFHNNIHFTTVSQRWSHCLFLYSLPVLSKDTGVYAAPLPSRWRKIISILCDAIVTASYCTYQNLQLISRKQTSMKLSRWYEGQFWIYKIEMFGTESIFVETLKRKE